MHESLQDKSKFSLLGQYEACINYGQNGVEEDDLRKTCTTHGVDGVCECYGQWSCGCLKFDGFLGQCRQVILYETPTYGAHHFSLRYWNSSEHGKASPKKPQWVDELQQKQPLNDMIKIVHEYLLVELGQFLYIFLILKF
ncbi:hypothetical protein E1A91_D10G182800v1 [Gossypium mustelinum]|uniref:Uncharacterized protein n=1 Tax=Gossypium mustelinum TaxID=34275 RepID=A0A5D2TAB4_GOSMU|nr:hypothetical protein E1A91_D10G182800v1 [Gossypium mustelinum]